MSQKFLPTMIFALLAIIFASIIGILLERLTKRYEFSEDDYVDDDFPDLSDIDAESDV